MPASLRLAVLAGLAVAWPLAASAADPAPLPLSGLELIGRTVLPRHLGFADTVVGGLSGLAFDASTQRFWALSDDRGENGPVRIYRLRLDLGAAQTGPLPVPVAATVDGVVTLAGLDGRPFAARSIDPEGLALLGGGFLLSTEGIARAGIAPFIAEVGGDGRVRRELQLPDRIVPAPGRGVRNNLGFESLALTPDARFLFAGIENALVQDGPEADVESGSPARILRFDRGDDGRRQEFVYPVDPVSRAAAAEGADRINGLADLLALDGERLLALERGFVEGVGNTARLYAVSLAGASDVAALDSLAGASFVAAHKSLVIDFGDLGVPMENFEGLAFGPELADGRGTIVVVSDDNFNPAQEATTFLVFAVDLEPLSVPRVQGASHRSPLAGRWVIGLEGVVTAVDRDSRSPSFWLESARTDGDPRTSEGVLVLWPEAGMLAPGRTVRVNGRVEEAAIGKGLPVTRVRAGALATLAEAQVLPPPVRLFSEVPIPARIDDDALAIFDPSADAVDLWESLEAMRVEVPGGTVVGPTAAYGELVLRPDGVAVAARTAAGGDLVLPGGPSLARALLSRRLVGSIPDLDVGARLAGPIAGIVDYSFANYKVLLLDPARVESAGDACGGETTLVGDRRHVTVAAFNVENLSTAGPAERFARLGEVIARRLRGPDLVALEEIQDDSGPARDDAVVTSAATLERLVAAVAAAGGPRYRAVWIDPLPDREGGQPGGNIRVAALVNPARLELVRRGAAGALDATAPTGRGRSLALSLSPGRVAPASPAFDLTEGEGVRRSLALETRFRGRRLFVIVNHWSSKYDDDRPFGATQPPRTPTLAKRAAQAREIRSFVERMLAADPGARVAVVGDLNDFEFSEAVATLAAAPLANLIERIPAAERYTYNFEGASQVLDHAVVTPAVAAGAAIEIVHVNADCADVRRTSDHDPVVVRLRVH